MDEAGQTRLLIGLSAIAMALPSAYTLKWSIPEKGQVGFLAYMAGACLLTLVGAITGRSMVMWLGFGLILIGYLWVVRDAYISLREKSVKGEGG